MVLADFGAAELCAQNLQELPSRLLFQQASDLFEFGACCLGTLARTARWRGNVLDYELTHWINTFQQGLEADEFSSREELFELMREFCITANSRRQLSCRPTTRESMGPGARGSE